MKKLLIGQMSDSVSWLGVFLNKETPNMRKRRTAVRSILLAPLFSSFFSLRLMETLFCLL